MRQILPLALICVAALAGCKKKSQPQVAGPRTPAVRRVKEVKPILPPKTVTSDPATRPKTGVKPPTPPVEPKPIPGPRIYVVAKGDRGFMSIARKLYGDPKRWKEIAKMNPDADTRKLRIGQKLKVPAK